MKIILKRLCLLGAALSLIKYLPGCMPEEYSYLASGKEKYARGDFEGAIKDLNELLKRNASFGGAYLHRGIARHALGDYMGAIGDFDRALLLSPDNATIYKCRVNLRFDLLDDLQARAQDSVVENRTLLEMQIVTNRIFLMTDLDRMIHDDPEDEWPYEQRGNLEFDSGDYPSAIEDYGRVLTLDDRAGWAYHNRGLARFEIGDDRGAIDDFTMAIGLDGTDGWAYYKRGLARTRTGEHDEGCMDLGRAKAMGIDEADRMLQQLCW